MDRIKRQFSALFDHISECMAPIIPIVLAGGIFKMIVLLLGAFHILSGTTETILSAIATAPFYFMPRRGGYYCVMLLPDFSELMESGEKVTFLGIPVVPATYAYSVIPIILLIYCTSHIVRVLKRLIRESLQPYFLAACAILLTSLLGILVIEPAVSLISNTLADALNNMQVKAPVVAWGLFCALTLLLVSTGMHWIFMTLAITQIGLTGVDYGIMAALFAANMSLGGCDLGVCVRSKQKAMVTVLVTGIAEPSIFGICFKEKTPMIGNVLGCMIAGIVQGILTVHCYIFTFASMSSILMFYSVDEAGNLVKAIVIGVVAFVASFLITLLDTGVFFEADCRGDAAAWA